MTRQRRPFTHKFKLQLVKLYENVREIIGHSAGANKTAELVYQAIASIYANLNDVKMFHT
ncbi:hypothetical protein ACQKNB_16815 [Lysinibacillus xylanilyticus]|uniref:hypothetical protein n=1 Tax=Lysinibacillus xylanilyticus TaxID=582475 RepID=UPI003D033A25